MKDKINVLFISPFEDMVEIVEKIKPDYPRLFLSVGVGNEDNGLKIAHGNYAANWDCIISRGNTATTIRRSVSIPVIEIEVTLSDVLNSLVDCSDLPPVIAVVGYRNVVSGLNCSKGLFCFELKVWGFDDICDVDAIFDEIQHLGIHYILCDTITYQFASQRGFHAHMLQSGETAIRNALNQAMLLLETYSALHEENQLLKQLVHANNESETVVFSADRKLYYSSLSKQDAPMLEYLFDCLSNFDYHDKFKLVKQQSGFFYRISAKKIILNDKAYYAYFYGRKIRNTSNSHRGVSYYSAEDIRKEIENSVFGISNIKGYYSAELNAALSRKSPVLIYGEVGVGKNHLAEMIYLNSQYINNPLVVIDCSLIGRKYFDYLLTKADSPLYDSGNTLFIKNIDAIDDDGIRRLLITLIEGDVMKRNRILISCSSQRGLSNVSGRPVLKVVSQLGCFVISMMPLRGQYDAIKNSTNLLLRDYYKRRNLDPCGIDPEAMSLLLHYDWPQNYDQLIRVLGKVATLAGNGPITKHLVEDALNVEMSFVQGETFYTSNTILNLSKSLEEINCDIAKIILEQNRGNQSATARSLQISRTTLWRMLKEHE